MRSIAIINKLTSILFRPFILNNLFIFIYTQCKLISYTISIGDSLMQRTRCSFKYIIPDIYIRYTELG